MKPKVVSLAPIIFLRYQVREALGCRHDATLFTMLVLTAASILFPKCLPF